MRWSEATDGRCEGLTSEEQPDNCERLGPPGPDSGEEHRTNC